MSILFLKIEINISCFFFYLNQYIEIDFKIELKKLKN